MSFRIGFGEDIHVFASGRKLVLGTVTVPGHDGLLGHSDADVVLHALSDALLGAIAAGDIGHLFPDTDVQWKGVDSKILLAKVVALAGERGWKVGNADITIALQVPKLAPHILSMRETLARVMGVPVDAVSVKATTTERLGFVGRGEGCEVWASVTVIKP